jgi:hypothetical protein
MFAIVNFAARKGFGVSQTSLSPKRRNLSRVAAQFLRARHIENATCRFDVPAIEMRRGKKPVLCLHKGAFNAGQHQHPIGR